MRQVTLSAGTILLMTAASVSAACASSSPATSSKESGLAEHEGKHHSDKHEHHQDQHHRFDDPQEWAKRFESEDRKEWQKPDIVIAALGLGTEQSKVVADIGSATGYFPVRIAPLAKRVYGVDIEPAMVDYLNARAKREGLANLTSILGTATTPNLPEAVDVALVVNTYHHIENRTAYFQALEFNAGGRLVIVDFRTDAPADFGPPAAMRLTVEVVERELAAAGFKMVESDTTSLPYHYVLLFVK